METYIKGFGMYKGLSFKNIWRYHPYYCIYYAKNYKSADDAFYLYCCLMTDQLCPEYLEQYENHLRKNYMVRKK